MTVYLEFSPKYLVVNLTIFYVLSGCTSDEECDVDRDRTHCYVKKGKCVGKQVEIQSFFFVHLYVTGCIQKTKPGQQKLKRVPICAFD